VDNLNDVKAYINDNEYYEINIYVQKFDDGHYANVDVGWSGHSGTAFTLGIEKSREKAMIIIRSAYKDLSQSNIKKINFFETEQDYLDHML
jgi:hypothetical protein